MNKQIINDNITLYNGDCLDVLQQIPDGSIDLIVTDPPYLIPTINGGGTVNKNRSFNKILEESLRQGQDITVGYDIDTFADIVNRIQGGNINAYFWCNKAQIPDYFRTYVDRLGCKFDILFWAKVNPMPTYSNKYLSDTEYCLYFHKGKGKTNPKSYDDARTCWFEPINGEDKVKFGHPTIKPIKMIDRLVRNSSDEGDTVLDPFLGSGTTAVACHLNNRRCIGIEINEGYFNIAKKRIENEIKNLKLF